ncbi:MAG: GspH/FimT family pseudopilin [Burkholderiaceae bacterium]|nr:GspH/FimT family pseudopilin [Burkholderiaceae bacterium]
MRVRCRSVKHPAGRARRANARGLSLVELLVVIVIVAILLSAGIPLFVGTLASARTADAANSLLAAHELARSEALRRGARVSVCRTANPAGTACGMAAFGGFAANDWAAGWIVWIDDGGTPGVLETGEEIVQRQDALNEGQGQRVVIAANVDVVRYAPSGLREAAGGAPAQFEVAYRNADPSDTPVMLRCLTVSVVGQARIARGAC